MFIFSLFFTFTYSKYASIDLGSQYIRISVSSISTELTMALNHQHQILTPSAIAFKMQDTPKYRHLTTEEGFNSTLKVGDDAIKYLKNHPESGTDRISYFLGRYKFTRNKGSNNPPIIANTTEMLSLILTKLFMDQQYAGLEGISVVLPRYYTLSQRESLTQSMYLARLPFLGIYDDDSAIIQLYYVKFAKKFLALNKNKKKNVLFVDIGAAGIRAYRVEFFSYGGRYNQPAANQTSYIWSEKTGGFAFNSKLSKALKITETKAQKRLIDKKIDDNVIKSALKDEIQEIVRVIKEACNGEISEVQIFGSASRYLFIQDVIQKIFSNSTSNFDSKSDTLKILKQKIFGKNEDLESEINQKYINDSVQVLRNLPASESIAQGSLYYLHALLNQSQYKMVDINKVPIYTTSIECGGVLEDYCIRNKNCSDYLIMHSTICKKLLFIATDEAEDEDNQEFESQSSNPLKQRKKRENKNKVPDGCGQIIGQYSLTNISKFSYDLTDELNGILALDSPSPTVITAVWCANPLKEEFQEEIGKFNRDDEKCEDIEVKQTPLTDVDNKKKYEFVQAVLNGDDQKKMIGNLRSKIDLLLRTIRKSLEDVKSDGQVGEMISQAKFAVESDVSVKEMREIVKKLENYCKSAGIKF